MSQSLADEAYKTIKSDIITCVLEPGQQIIQSQLVEKYQIGTTPVREALQRLVQEGFVQPVPRFGYVVSAITFTDVREIFELRSIVESAAARLAAVRGSHELLDQILTSADFAYVYRDRQSYVAFLACNTDSHRSIAEVAGNQRLVDLVSRLLKELTRLFHLGLDGGFPMKADLILHNAHIYTVDSARLWAETVACAGGRVLAVGGNDELMGLAGPNTQVIDAGGRLVLPGITDGHVHLAMFADWRCENQVSLFGVRDFDEVRRRVRQAVERTDEGQWVYGRGWDESLWDGPPSRAHLDDVAPQTPVVLRRLDLHTCWVNSAALERAGITRETPDPPKGRMGRDATGEPTGILYELSAIEMVERHMPRPTFAEMQDWTRHAISEAHRLGVTGIHDQRTPREDGRSFRLLQSLRRQGELDLRVHMAIAAESLAEAATLGLQPGFGDDRLWIGPVKAFADGSMGGRTALMLEPFEGDSLEGNPNNCGIAVRPVEDLRELVRRAGEAGFPLAVHAVGDRAVRDVIDVFSEFPRGASDSAFNLPHLIEHTQLIHPDDISRLSRHGIVASMQPVHLIPEWRTADRVWGRRARTAYAFRSLLDHGTHISFGSDAPYETLNPLEGIYAAVTRQDRQGKPEGGWYPEQRISVAEAIRCYTMGPALAAGRQHVQGSITPGKWADMVMLSRDIFEIPADEIADVHVVLTIFDGRVVYREV